MLYFIVCVLYIKFFILELLV